MVRTRFVSPLNYVNRFRMICSTLCYSINWEYETIPACQVDEYERARPVRRRHFELVLPRKIRYDLLRREWCCTEREIVQAVRQNVQIKNQRKATVNNLGKASKMEEMMERAGRKFKRIITFSKPISVQVKDLEAQMNEAQRRRAQSAIEMQMSSEYGRTEMTSEAEDSVDDAV